MTALLAERLESARRNRLIKRATECDLFQSALQADPLSFHLLYILGPGGVGKTTLLHEFGQLAAAAQVAHVYLDGRNLEASPEFFLISLQQSIFDRVYHGAQSYMTADHFAQAWQAGQDFTLEAALHYTIAAEALLAKTAAA